MWRRAHPLGIFLPRVGGVALCLMAAAAGCTRTPVEDTKIAAADTTEFFRWKRDIASELSPERQRQLDSTLEELRLDLMLRHEASGHDAIEAAVCQRLNHLSVKEALLLGAQLKWQRLAAERDDLQRVLNANSHLITKPGDQNAAVDLDQYRTTLQKRVDTANQELPALEKEISELGGPPPVFQSDSPATKPVAVTHEEALHQIADMLEQRRTAAAFRDGQRSVKIDREGKMLEGDKRSEFLAKKSAALRDGKVVIPVHIKGRWLLFEAPDQAPALPEDVRAQLSAAEIATFKRDWLEVEAERWARELAKDLPDPPAAKDDEPEPPPAPPPR